jgi:hypothetical protein
VSHDLGIEGIKYSIDDYLKSLSQNSAKNEVNSRLISTKEMIKITNIAINRESCDDFARDLLLLVFVFTQVDDFTRRQTIHKT